MQKRKKKQNCKTKVRCLVKIISVILSCLMCSISFSGCMHNSVGEISDKTQVSLGGYFTHAPVTERYEYDIRAVELFEELHPDTDIVDSGWFFTPDTYLAKAEGNTLPTIYYVPMTEAYNIIKQGYAADITNEYMERGYYEHTRDFILENISRDGKVYLIPTGIYDLGLFVNMSVYKEAGFVAEDGTPYQPQTWEETAELAKKIKDTTGNPGFVFPTGGRIAGWLFMPIAWSYGTVFEEYEDGKWQANFNSPECAAALQYIKNLKWKYDVLQDEDIKDSIEYRRYVAKNKSGFSITDEESVKRTIDHGIDRNDIGLVAMPAGSVRKVTLVGGGYNVINKDATPEQIHAAMNWVEYERRPTKLTDVYKKKTDEQLVQYDKLGYIIGVESVGLWEGTAEAERYLKQKVNEMINVNPNHIKQYNDKSTVEFKLEEPIEAQMLYEILGNVINKVLTDENADPGELLKEAAYEFQTKCLDYTN